MLGIVLGGAVIKNCQLSLRQAASMCIVCMGLCVLFDIPLLFMGCPTQRIAGLDASGRYVQLYVDRVLLFLALIVEELVNFSRCNCIRVNEALGYAKPGGCGSRCSEFLVPFVTLACISGFVASIAHTPAFVMILRSVKPEDKSFAIGLQFLMTRVAAWLPAPVLYGSIIDTTCLLWLRRCDTRASCRYYNHTQFRQRFMALQLMFEISGFLCFCIVYLLFWRKEKQALELGIIPESQSPA
ncbi:hypothetical protein lerEdw1_005782 [Lerista edwardsae]|nr:hypothetical protein lerEdw1_005782 [Lerista edwardsae]